MHNTTYFLPNILIVVLTLIDKTWQEGDNPQRYFMAENNRIDLDTTNRFLTETLVDLAPKTGYFETGIQGFEIIRHDEPSGIIRRVYSPVIILMVQGKKLSIIGTEEVVWGKNKVTVHRL